MIACILLLPTAPCHSAQPSTDLISQRKDRQRLPIFDFFSHTASGVFFNILKSGDSGAGGVLDLLTCSATPQYYATALCFTHTHARTHTHAHTTLSARRRTICCTATAHERGPSLAGSETTRGPAAAVSERGAPPVVGPSPADLSQHLGRLGRLHLKGPHHVDQMLSSAAMRTLVPLCRVSSRSRLKSDAVTARAAKAAVSVAPTCGK